MALRLVLLSQRRLMSSVGYTAARPRASGDGISKRNLPVNTILKFVPQQEAWIVERMGRFNRILSPGPQLLIPILDQVKYVASLKEIAISIPSQSAITQDNVSLDIDGVLYVKVDDPFKVAYGVQDAEFAVTALAQTTMRAEIGKMSLDKTLSERQALNTSIVDAISQAAASWGIQCLRYEIKDIHPPDNIVRAMHSQVEADRERRAQVLASEGERQAAINKAEGYKKSLILEAEARKEKTVREAEGLAQSVLIQAQAKARAIEEIAGSIAKSGSGDEGDNKAVSYIVAEKYIEAFGQLAKEGTTVLMGAGKGSTDQTSISGGLNGIGNIPEMTASALSIYNAINTKKLAHGDHTKTGTSDAAAHSQQQKTKGGHEFPLN
ncbi:hypothetical protein MIR68_007291 [Amoeboaphelidium protococcarum]|nr:hypothetical protein MIR68_007291 [Amoeboaphelidium protococcarum]